MNVDDVKVLIASVCQMNIDDVKVLIASVAGLGNWLVDIDLILKIVLSAASLVYVVLQIIKHLKNN
jgi:hypothetical protein